MEKYLTKVEKKILSFINNSIKKRGFPPTEREICKYFKFSSRNTAHYYIRQLKEKGHLKFRIGSCNKRVARGLKIRIR
ncbi:MAG: winged helix DNA-binding protein [Elusimicrobiota bacterium]